MDAYRDQYATLFNGGKDVTLLAISERDTPEQLASWAKDARLPFTMAYDRDGAAGKAFGGVGRSVFVIAPDGTVAYAEKRFREVDPTAYTALAEAVQAARRTAAPAPAGKPAPKTPKAPTGRAPAKG